MIDTDFVRGNKDFRLSKGSCSTVLELLRVSQECDSMAVSIFKEEYELINMPLYLKNWLFSQSQMDFIRFFVLEKNKKYDCKSTVFKGIVPALLVD